MKRILLLSTFFYPAPSVGSVRITNWAKVLPGLGYRPLAICRDYGYRTSLENLADNVHPDVRLLQFQFNGQVAPAEDCTSKRCPDDETLRRSVLAKTLAATLHRCIIPDSQWLFWKRIFPKVLASAQEFQADLIISTAPSFSLHEVGRRLKKQLEVPWIADYRDPMMLDHRFRPRGWASVMWPRFATFERHVYEQADAIIHAIPLHARWARLHYSFARRRCALLRHPVPEDIVSGSIVPLKAKVSTRRSISVVGFIRPQIVRMLGEAVAQLIREDPQTYDLELRLIGRPLDDPLPLQALLGPRLIETGRVRHDIAKQHIAGADVLVNAVSAERQHATNISSKLYEYAATKRPIISINPTRSDRLLLRELAALVIDKPTVDSLAAALRQALAADPALVAESYADFLNRHSWYRHVEHLRLVLDHVQGTASVPGDLRDLDTAIPKSCT